MPARPKIYIPLLILCIISLFWFLGAAPFNTRGEPREAVVAMSMLQDGNWILPVNNGDEIAFKPPMLHWLVAAFSWLLGGISEFTSRLPSALGATGIVLATYGFFSRRNDATVGIIAALITLTCFELHRAAMTCRVDLLLAAFMVGALMAGHHWAKHGARRLPWLMILLLAGAALTKGPVGVVLPCAVVALYMLTRGKAGFLTLLWKFTVVALLGLVPLGLWYLAAYNEPNGGARFLQLIYEENVLRFTGQMTYASHINPWPYNVMTVLTGFLPFSLVLLFMVPLGMKRLWQMRNSVKSTTFAHLRTRLVEAWRRMTDIDAFAFLSFAVIFVFYCIPASKRSVYLLPIYPFLAYFLARYLLWMCDRHPRVLRAFGLTLSVLALALTAVFIAIRLGWQPAFVNLGHHAAENGAFLQALSTAPIGFSGWLLVVMPALLAVNYCSHNKRPYLFTLTGIVFFLQLSLDGVYIPKIMEVKTDRGVAAAIQQAIPSSATICSYRTDVLEANRMHPFTVNFYLNNRIVPIDKMKPLPKTCYLLVGNDEIEDFQRVYPQYRPRLVWDSQHRSCDDRKVLKLYLINE